VKIFGPWGIQVREIRSGEGYGINNSFDAHFGLGTNTMVDSVIIVWPSGTIDNLLDVAADQFVTVIEGSSPVNTSNMAKEAKVVVYPNPNEGLFTIDLGTIKTATIKITDLSGRVVLSQSSIGRYNHINLEAFANGVYTYEVTAAEGKFAGKVVKQ